MKAIDSTPDDQPRRPELGRSADLPISTTIVLGLTALVTSTQFVWPQVLETLRRTPNAFENGEWWRAISPMFVHAYGWPHLLFNLAWIAVIGVFAERRFGHLRWLILYFIPGVIGELAGFLWEPHAAGASVGGAGLLGGLAVWLLVRRTAVAWGGRWWGYFIIFCGALLTLARNLHGPPMLAGAVLGLLMLRRSGRSPA